MEFLTLEEFKTFEGLKSPEDDIRIQFLVDSTNSLVTDILGIDNLTDYVVKSSIDPITVFLSTDAKSQDIIVTDDDANPITGLSGGKGVYTLVNEFVGNVNFTFPAPFTTVPADLKLATAQLVRYYRSNEYKASMSGTGQSVTNVPLTNNIPRHVMSVLSLYRVL